jgi:hypothetical protein
MLHKMIGANKNSVLENGNGEKNGLEVQEDHPVAGKNIGENNVFARKRKKRPRRAEGDRPSEPVAMRKELEIHAGVCTSETKKPDPIDSRNYLMQKWLEERVTQLKENPPKGCENPSIDEDGGDVPLVAFGVLTPKEFFTEAGRLGSAEAARILNLCLENDQEIRYLCSSRWMHLGWVSGMNCIPHPIRTYNLQTYVYLQACGQLHELGDKYVLRADFSRQDIKDHLFRSTVLRTAPSVGWYYLYAELKKQKKEIAGNKEVFIPSMDDIDCYLEFLEHRSQRWNHELLQQMFVFQKLVQLLQGYCSNLWQFLEGGSQCVPSTARWDLQHRRYDQGRLGHPCKGHFGPGQLQRRQGLGSRIHCFSHYCRCGRSIAKSIWQTQRGCLRGRWG